MQRQLLHKKVLCSRQMLQFKPTFESLPLRSLFKVITSTFQVNISLSALSTVPRDKLGFMT